MEQILSPNSEQFFDGDAKSQEKSEEVAIEMDKGQPIGEVGTGAIDGKLELDQVAFDPIVRESISELHLNAIKQIFSLKSVDFPSRDLRLSDLRNEIGYDDSLNPFCVAPDDISDVATEMEKADNQNNTVGKSEVVSDYCDEGEVPFDHEYDVTFPPRASKLRRMKKFLFKRKSLKEKVVDRKATPPSGQVPAAGKWSLVSGRKRNKIGPMSCQQMANENNDDASKDDDDDDVIPYDHDYDVEFPKPKSSWIRKLIFCM